MAKSKKQPLTEAQVFFAAGMASDITQDSFRECLRLDSRGRATKNMGFKVVTYLLHVALSHSQEVVAEAFKIGRPTVSRFCTEIEDMRADWRDFNERLQSVERLLEARFSSDVRLILPPVSQGATA